MDGQHKLDDLQDGFTQFVGDNVDHNTDTLDGKGTFHGMGIIASSILDKDMPEKSEANTNNFKKRNDRDNWVTEIPAKLVPTKNMFVRFQ